jgi:predicted GTPase
LRTETAIKDSDLLIWIIEYDKFTELDARISHMIRKYKADNFLVVANKADNEDMILQSYSQAGK